MHGMHGVDAYLEALFLGGHNTRPNGTDFTDGLSPVWTGGGSVFAA